MNNPGLEAILRRLRDNEITVEKAMKALKEFYYEDIGHAKVDHHRALRNGMPEAIFGPGKTPEQVAEIACSLCSKGSGAIVTRASKEQFEAVKEVLPGAVFHESARMITVTKLIPAAKFEPAADLSKVCKQTSDHAVAVVSAGTADIPVAEEAAITLEFIGVPVKRIYDVGVAGLHRLLDKMEEISSCRTVIVVAGMDGALPSVVAGMIDIPVIAVPTSIGYGASFSGVAALLTMLNSCSTGVGVVNIDNGFGAAALAYAIISAGGGQR